MAALSSVVPTKAGVAFTAAAVSASDTVNTSQLGTLGGHLLVFNAGGSPDTVAITDSGLTPAGQAGVSTGGSVTNATNEAFYISPKQADPATGLVTITHSFTTSVTCLFIPLG